MLWDEIERLRTVRRRLEWALKEETMIEESVRDSLNQEIDLLERELLREPKKRTREEKHQYHSSHSSNRSHKNSQKNYKSKKPVVVAVNHSHRNRNKNHREESQWNQTIQSIMKHQEPVEENNEPSHSQYHRNKNHRKKQRTSSARCYKCGS